MFSWMNASKRITTISSAVLILFLPACGTLGSPISTATPIPQPTITAVGADSKPCEGRIQVSAPVVVRAEGVGGDTSHTEYGKWAMSPRAVSTGAGILVTWHTGINGQYPVPNSYVRLLDDNGQPVGEIGLPFERSVVEMSSFASKEDGALLTFCGAYKNANHGMTSVLLDSYGKFLSEQRRFSTERGGCGYEKADVIWTGSRLLFAWHSSYYGAEGFVNDISLDVADVNGNTLLERKLRTDGESNPHFAYGHGLVLMVVATRTGDDFIAGNDNRGQTHLAVHRFDMDGNEIGAPLILEPMPGREAEFGVSYIVPTEEGWLIVASTSLVDSRYYVARLTPNGSLISGPDLVGANTNISFADVIPYGDGAVALIGGDNNFSKVLFFWPDGMIKQEWYPVPDESMGLGDLVVHKGRLFMIYATALTGKPVTNKILVREFQCIP